MNLLASNFCDPSKIFGSENYSDLILEAVKIKEYLDTNKIKGLQKLKLSVELNKAEIKLLLDREYAKRSGLSTGQIASTIWAEESGEIIE